MRGKYATGSVCCTDESLIRLSTGVNLIQILRHKFSLTVKGGITEGYSILKKCLRKIPYC